MYRGGEVLVRPVTCYRAPGEFVFDMVGMFRVLGFDETFTKIS